nr:RecName: Full=Insect toxin PlIT [Parabuthus liosoma]
KDGYPVDNANCKYE